MAPCPPGSYTYVSPLPPWLLYIHHLTGSEHTLFCRDGWKTRRDRIRELKFDQCSYPSKTDFQVPKLTPGQVRSLTCGVII